MRLLRTTTSSSRSPTSWRSALTNQLAFSAAIKEPPATSDLMTNLQSCAETNLFATEALAEMLQIELPGADMPEPKDSYGATGHQHLVGLLRSQRIDDAVQRHQFRTAFRLARHLQRIDEIGDPVEEANLDDLHCLLGHRPANWREGDAELEHFVLANADTSVHDEALLNLFHRRNLRAHMLLGPPGEAMTHHHQSNLLRPTPKVNHDQSRPVGSSLAHLSALVLIRTYFTDLAVRMAHPHPTIEAIPAPDPHPCSPPST